MTNTERDLMRQLIEVAQAALEWIDAVPANIELPAMPGFDRDWADEVIASSIEQKSVSAESVQGLVAEIVAEDGYPFIKWHGDESRFYEVHPIGTKFYTHAAPVTPVLEPLTVKLKDDWRTDDWGKPIIYDTDEVDEVTGALTGDEGEEDALTVLNSMVRYVGNVWPGKTAMQVLIEYEESMLATSPAAPVQKPVATTAASHIAGEVGYCQFHTAVPNDTKLYIQPALAAIPDVDWLANVIRVEDGNNSLGAGALAEKIVEAMTEFCK